MSNEESRNFLTKHADSESNNKGIKGIKITKTFLKQFLENGEFFARLGKKSWKKEIKARGHRDYGGLELIWQQSQLAR